MKVLDFVQFGEPVALGHSIALDGAQVQIDSYLAEFRESFVYSLLRGNPR